MHLGHLILAAMSVTVYFFVHEALWLPCNTLEKKVGVFVQLLGLFTAENLTRSL